MAIASRERDPQGDRGTVAGVPDIICISQGRCYALELKAERGRVTDVQRVVHERLREAGAHVAVAQGLDQALAQLEAWNLLRHECRRKARGRHARTAIGIIGGTPGKRR